MIKIHSKRTFKFRNSEGGVCVVNAQTFSSVPDWVNKDSLFKLAVSSGIISVIQDSADKKKIETSDSDETAKLAELRAEAKELGIKNYAQKKAETLTKEIEEAKALLLKGAEPPEEDDSGD